LNVRAGDDRITMFAKKKVEENYSLNGKSIGKRSQMENYIA
jgi:hypothetical protein